MKKTYEKCPGCGQKNLYVAFHNGTKKCRNCDHIEPHGKHDSVLAYEDRSRPGSTPPKVTLQISIETDDNRSNYQLTQEITPEQLEAIADILMSPEDRMLQQRHAFKQPSECTCGYQWPLHADIDSIRKCMVLDQLAAI